MAIGLVTARWALEALGVFDYGIMGVVGGLVGFISFFNEILSAAVGRFYAIFIGKMMTMSVAFEESGAMPNGI